MDFKKQTEAAELLLKEMIPIPSVTFKEAERSRFLAGYLERMLRQTGASESVKIIKVKDNILICSPKKNCKTLMLCAHIDTVPPADGYTFEPYALTQKEGRLIGLGVNDDGASLACMAVVFSAMAVKTKNLSLLLCISTQEEKSGKDGMKAVMNYLKTCTSIPYPDFAIVGEPTGMKAAIAEKGLLVVDGVAYGQACHAATGGKDNAIYNAFKDIEAILKTRFTRKSALLGPTHLVVTQINAGKCHNAQPAKCEYVIDIRPNDRYTNEEILEKLKSRVGGTLKARSLDHVSRVTPEGSVLMKAVECLGLKTYASATSSDWSLLDIPAIKIGPGDSSRSHKADEYVTRKEVRSGIEGYTAIIQAIDSKLKK
ncbi:MAG: M20/M25/M40 family metallo-hydrolase [Bacteroidales bacterium]|nr:M20/M25/M40 family metallo-hydrolase [Bacteroidales bacterium]